jgi:hypothetical protein
MGEVGRIGEVEETFTVHEESDAKLRSLGFRD